MSDYGHTLLSGLTDVARDYLRTGVRVTLETNVLPALTVYSGGGGQQHGGAVGLGKLLGIRGGIVVRNAQGGVLARFGEPAAPDPLRVALLLAGVGLAGYVAWRVLR